MVGFYQRRPEYLMTLQDGTVKQLNPFSGTEVWTVAGRADRPVAVPRVDANPIETDQDGRHCAFCEDRYLDTPPEKARLVHDAGWQTRHFTPAGQLGSTVAQFRRVPNLFEILSYDYWRANYGYEMPESVRAQAQAYLATPTGHEHILGLIRAKFRAQGQPEAAVDSLAPTEIQAFCDGFFGGCHDVIIARRHFVDGAKDTTQLASSGTLSPDEHAQFIAFTVESTRSLIEANRYIRYVVVFQNWLKEAGASFDHLHKQLVGIDERGGQHEVAHQRLRQNPNTFNDDAANYAAYNNLILAENDHALAFAGFGHRYPTIEIFSKSGTCDPWEQQPEELRGMSDVIHAMHAATGTAVPCNEEWHYRPVDFGLAMPWRVVLKWRVSTLAGFEGATKIYLNTISPYVLRDRVVPALYDLRHQGQIGDLRIATECACRPNPLRYQD
ncbi:MAG: DUF4921 family protein [Micrococcales bacterium]|nr:DUF4921 family protein [Micrococcales bacterium]